MGVDYSGYMVVGNEYEEISIPEDVEDVYDWLDENDMRHFSPHYDAPLHECSIGFSIGDVEVGKMEVWLQEVKELAVKFKEITGADAYLFGTQHIY